MHGTLFASSKQQAPIYKLRLSVQDIQHTTEELISEEIVTLAVTAITFLYYEFVVSSPAFPSDQLTTVLSKRTSLATQKSSRLHNGLHGYRSSFYSNLDTAPVSAGSSRTVSIAASQMQDVGSLAASITLQAEDQRSGLFSIVQLWANRSRMYSQSKWATNFARPAVILSLRALVDKVFSDAFPIWMTSAHGTAQLQDIDAQLLQWFDPHGFNSSISLLQSLPTAGHERTGHRHSQPAKSVHKHKRQHFNGTTSLVRAFLCEPKTAACRRLQHNSSVIKQQNLHMASELSQQQKGVMMKTAENLLLHSH